MGSFNVGCGLSNLTVHEGDEVGFLFITENASLEYSRRRGTRGRVETRTMHLYATDLYEPYLPPVYGTYDDYGRIADLRESPVTEAIERIFGRPALEVINAVGQDRGLYSTYGTIAPLYLPAETVQVLEDYSASDEAKFAVLGFKKYEQAPTGYTVAYRYEDYDLLGRPMELNGMPSEMVRLQYDLVRRGTSEVPLRDFPALNGLEELFSSFAEVTKLLPGFAEEDHYAVRELQRISGMFFLAPIYNAIKGPILDHSWDREAAGRFEENFTRAMGDLAEGALYSPSLSDLQRSVGMRDRAWKELVPLVGTGEYGEISRLLSVMGAVNRMVMPSFNGEQFGDDPASRELTKATAALLEERRARFEEDED